MNAGVTSAPSQVGIYGEPPSDLATDTAKSNINASPYILSVADLINKANQSAQQAANAGRLGPQGTALQDELLKNYADEAAGKIPQSEVEQLALLMAERGGGGGFGVDSPNTNAALARAFNIRQGDLVKQAGEGYLGLLAANPSAPIYRAEGGLVTPDEYAKTADAQAAMQLAYYKAALDALKNLNPGGGGGGPRTTPTTTTTTTPPPPANYPPPYVPPKPTVPPPTNPYIPDYTIDPRQNYDPYADLPGYNVSAPPSNTYYDPFTDTSNYDYGLGNYYDTVPATGNLADMGFGDWYDPSLG